MPIKKIYIPKDGKKFKLPRKLKKKYVAIGFNYVTIGEICRNNPIPMIKAMLPIFIPIHDPLNLVRFLRK